MYADLSLDHQILKKVIERMKDLPEKEQDILASFILEHLGGKEGTAGMDDLHPEETHPWMLEEAHSEFESESTEDIGLS
ncbi:MAG TPA: hypothetical protein PK683_21610, partial [Leptospiraceae bacterium]|nr:hypothetical protein [Leptospiraceae bacterium]